jgi:hypothetical protein
MAGWAALAAVQIGSQADLRRDSFDAEDNLLAPKCVTQVRKCASDMLSIIFAIGLAARALLSISDQVRRRRSQYHTE